MANILVSWIGNADIISGSDDVLTGPLVSILRYEDFSDVYLLHNQDDPLIGEYTERLEKEFGPKFQTTHADLESPIHFADIHKALESVLAKTVKAHPSDQLYIQLTSGTPTMAAVSILLGKSKYSARFLQSSKEQGVQEAEIPFDIAADFLPSLAIKRDRDLQSLISGEAPISAEFDSIITQSLAMERLKQQAAILAQREVPVLIYGETGTGKELFAKAIRNSSTRADKPFLILNCGAVPKDLIDSTLFGHVKGAFTGATADRSGYFEKADSGTLFLDEFGELPLESQVRLLRVLQDGSYNRLGDTTERKADVRIIAATNKNLSAEVTAGRFREDLFYRVAIGVLQLPPLRERTGDLGVLSQAILKQINQEAGAQPSYKDKKISASAKKLSIPIIGRVMFASCTPPCFGHRFGKSGAL